MNRESYNLIAEQWNSVRNRFVGRERDYLDLLLEATTVGDTVLDLGCGTGRPIAHYVVHQGRRVIGVDQSEAMLAIAKQTQPEQTWLLVAMEDYTPAVEVDAAILWDSPFHIRRDAHEPILRTVITHLRQGHRLMLSVGGSAHSAFTDTTFGQPFFYDSHDPEQALALLERLGCKIVLAEFMNRPDGGRDKGRLAVIAEKR
jgi:SAM-dependent methyltransferase